jgi:CubicO group peptidase (beta-lactamase class C family)
MSAVGRSGRIKVTLPIPSIAGAPFDALAARGNVAMTSRIAIGLGCLAAFLGLAASAAAPDEVARIERAIELHVSNGQFIGSVLVARDGTPILSKGYGEANLEWHIPNSPVTKFRLGSVTKQFTAACVLLLEERGKLKTDDPVKKYLPDAPPAWDEITIFHLLTHTSGIPNFTNFPDYRSTKTLPTTPEKLVARFRDKPLDFPPGSSWSYSNSGYVLLGYLIEKVSGESYSKFVQDNIFSPLGMKDSGYDSNTEVIDRRAVGYAPDPGGPVIAGYIDMSIPFAAGGLYSTTENLLRWEQALYGGKVLSDASLQKMTTPFLKDYAFGLIVRETPNHDKIYSHNGGIEGFNTSLSYIPADKAAVIVLANLNGRAVDDIAADLTRIIDHDPAALISERAVVHIASDKLDRLAGHYRFPEGDVMTVSRVDDHLRSEESGAPMDMFPQSDTEFFSKLDDTHFTFSTDKKGRLVALVLFHGHENRGTRIADAEAGRLADELARRIRDKIAAPGSDAALRRSIAEIVAGTPDYSHLGHELADITREQLPLLHSTFASWGDIKSIAFMGVGPMGGDIYNVTFEKSTVEFRIRLGPDGKIVAAQFHLLP